MSLFPSIWKLPCPLKPAAKVPLPKGFCPGTMKITSSAIKLRTFGRSPALVAVSQVSTNSRIARSSSVIVRLLGNSAFLPTTSRVGENALARICETLRLEIKRGFAALHVKGHRAMPMRHHPLAVDPAAAEDRSPRHVDFLSLCRRADDPVKAVAEGNTVARLRPGARVLDLGRGAGEPIAAHGMGWGDGVQ